MRRRRWPYYWSRCFLFQNAIKRVVSGRGIVLPAVVIQSPCTQRSIVVPRIHHERLGANGGIETTRAVLTERFAAHRDVAFARRVPIQSLISGGGVIASVLIGAAAIARRHALQRTSPHPRVPILIARIVGGRHLPISRTRQQRQCDCPLCLSVHR